MLTEDLLCVVKDGQGMFDSFIVTLEDFLHFPNQPVTHNVRLSFWSYSEALLAVWTPLGTAKINPWIIDQLAAVATFELWFVLEKFHRTAATRTLHLKNVFRFPESLILSGAFDHCRYLFGGLVLGIYHNLTAAAALALLLVGEELKAFAASGTIYFNGILWIPVLWV